jgi:hypothetical protein
MLEPRRYSRVINRRAPPVRRWPKVFDPITPFYTSALSASIASRAKEKGAFLYPIVYTDRSINGSAFFLEASRRALRVQDTLLDSRRTRRCVLSPLASHCKHGCIASETYHHRFSSPTDVVHHGRIGTTLLFESREK